MSATAAKQKEKAPKVVVREDTEDYEWVMSRLKPMLHRLPKTLTTPQRVTVTLPETSRRARDGVEVMICEGELGREYIHLSGRVYGGLGMRYNDNVALTGGCITGGQLDRLILALQLARAEADKLGLRTPRSIPEVKLV
jgi:hypothetical protein